MKVLSVSSDFSIKGVMEFCKCSRLSALLFLCYLLRETKCHWKFGSVSTLTTFVKNSRRPQKHCVKLSPNLRDIPALPSIVFRAGQSQSLPHSVSGSVITP